MKKEIEKIADKLVYAYKKKNLLIQSQESIQKISKTLRDLENFASQKLKQKL